MGVLLTEFKFLNNLPLSMEIPWFYFFMYCDLWPYVLWPLDFQIQKRIVSAETIWGNTVYIFSIWILHTLLSKNLFWYLSKVQRKCKENVCSVLGPYMFYICIATEGGPFLEQEESSLPLFALFSSSNGCTSYGVSI